MHRQTTNMMKVNRKIEGQKSKHVYKKRAGRMRKRQRMINRKKVVVIIEEERNAIKWKKKHNRTNAWKNRDRKVEVLKERQKGGIIAERKKRWSEKPKWPREKGGERDQE